MRKSVASSFFTTVNASKCWTALNFLCNPFLWGRWKNGKYQKKLKTALTSYLGVTKGSFFLFYNARTALFHGLKHLEIEQGDEVIMQAYTCVSVPNAIIARGAIPVYVDIDPHTLNIDPDHIQAKITPNTKAILIQHTLGIPADIEAIQQLCKKHNLLLIEDCAHALGAEYRDQKVGTFGDMAIFSFGRDKIISGVNGGALLMQSSPYPKTNDVLYEYKTLTPPSYKKIAQNLLYAVLAYIAYLTYDIAKIGKGLYYIAGKKGLNVFPSILAPGEKECDNHDFSSLMPNALACLIYTELKKIDHYNDHRRENTQAIRECFPDTIIVDKRNYTKPVYLRAVVVVNNRDSIIQYGKQNNIHMGRGDRYQNPIGPAGVNMAKAQYILGSCPHAESVSSRVINLPNHPNVGSMEYLSTIKDQIDLL